MHCGCHLAADVATLLADSLLQRLDQEARGHRHLAQEAGQEAGGVPALGDGELVLARQLEAAFSPIMSGTGLNGCCSGFLLSWQRLARMASRAACSGPLATVWSRCRSNPIQVARCRGLPIKQAMPGEVR